MSEGNDAQTGEALPRPQLSLRNRWWLSFIGGLIMSFSAIGIVVIGFDLAASFDAQPGKPIPDGTFAAAFAIVWLLSTGANMIMLRRFRGTATVNKRGVDLQGEV